MNLGRMTRTTFGALVLTLVFSGCGGGSSASSSSSAAGGATSPTDPASTPAEATTSSASTGAKAAESELVLDMPLKSSVKLDPLPARYTCDGANVSPPITWSKVPPHTAELFLFVFNALAVHGKNFDDWAVAGLKPTLHGLSAAKLPPGAIVGRNDFGKTGYSLCPPKGKKLSYLFILYAVPHKLGVKPGFNANEVRKMSGNIATHGGLLGLSYKRR